MFTLWTGTMAWDQGTRRSDNAINGDEQNRQFRRSLQIKDYPAAKAYYVNPNFLCA